MTRKEELKQKAKEAVDLVYDRVDRDANLDEYDRRECIGQICAMFFQVEREVLERVDRCIDAADHMGDVRGSIYSQLEELT